MMFNNMQHPTGTSSDYYNRNTTGKGDSQSIKKKTKIANNHPIPQSISMFNRSPIYSAVYLLSTAFICTFLEMKHQNFLVVFMVGRFNAFHSLFVLKHSVNKMVEL